MSRRVRSAASRAIRLRKAFNSGYFGSGLPSSSNHSYPIRASPSVFSIPGKKASFLPDARQLGR